MGEEKQEKPGVEEETKMQVEVIGGQGNSPAVSTLALAESQAKSLEVLSSSVKQIADFLSSGGLNQLLSGYARSQAVKDILGGLAAHDGRNSLDARVLGQNALEITEAVELVFEKYAERLAEKAKGERDPEIHEVVEEYVPRSKR